MRILIVDDHEALRAGVRSVLESRGLEVCGEAADGQEALAKALQLRPDLVILDLLMSGMDGLSVLRQLLRDRPWQSVM